MTTISRIQELARGLSNIDLDRVVDLVGKMGYYEAARILGYDISHYNNLLMSGRLAIEHVKSTAPPTWKAYVVKMKSRLSPSLIEFSSLNEERIQRAIDHNSHLDYDHDWFSANTMITTYSARTSYGEAPLETPQYTWMRIAIHLYSSVSVEDVLETYQDMALGLYTPASPTIFNAGMQNGQLSSCFLLSIGDDLKSILKMGIYNAGMITRASGGLGIDVSRVRHSEITGAGMSQGVIPMLYMYNSMIRYIDQGGRRKGAATIFLRPHHLDIEDFIQLSRKIGDKHLRAHDMETCIWTSWIFWERVQSDGKWTLFCPARVAHLNDLYGKDFTEAYIMCEEDETILPSHKKVIRARELYEKILDVQRESGMPFIMNGDAANFKSNQKNLGYIKSSNLCLEIIEYTDENTIASCNLHSLSWRMFARKRLDRNLPTEESIRDAIDFNGLGNASYKVIRNLNRVIDTNWYPLDELNPDGTVREEIINKTNKRHRPVGMGGSGFQEMLDIMDLPFEDPLTVLTNKMVFACMYFNALASSVQQAILQGEYESFRGSPASEGRLQFDLWAEEFELLGENPLRKKEDDIPVDPEIWGQRGLPLVDEQGDMVDMISPSWTDIKRCIIKYGLANSLLIALMPTATTAQIRRNCEKDEAHQSNLYSRKVLKCSYPVINRFLISDMEEIGAWNSSFVEFIRVRNGSIQSVSKYIRDNPELFPSFNGDLDRVVYLEKKYKTMWEISQKHMMKLSADRSRYVCHSSSNNLYIRNCTDEKLRAAHIVGNMLGNKTIMYYLRQTGGETIKFTADPSLIEYISGIKVDTVDKKEPERVCDDGLCCK